MTLWVLGDSWADPTCYPWAPSAGWPTLLAARLGLGLVNSGVSGSGYAATAGIPTFPAQAARGAGAGAGVVLVWGSLNDSYQGHSPAEVGAAAATTYALLTRLCPAAPLVVAGPQWGAAPPPPSLLASSEAVRAAATVAGATFLDPSRWLADRADLILPDGLHPDPGGHALIADLLTPEVLYALAARTPPELPHGEEGGWPAPVTVGAAATQGVPGADSPA